jgi:hypothetical protein
MTVLANRYAVRRPHQRDFPSPERGARRGNHGQRHQSRRTRAIVGLAPRSGCPRRRPWVSVRCAWPLNRPVRPVLQMIVSIVSHA